MTNTLFIPQKIKVGYQSRQDTYTKKLAYVIYYDEKGKLRKEPSWQVWRDEKLGADDFDNTPTEGFVLNKKVGGYSVHWGNFRQAYVRVYDPRGFEFEISIPNLLYILEHTSSIKGKGLEGSFVYGWDGADLVLLPTCSPDYEELSDLNRKRFSGEKITAKDLKIGYAYLTKNNHRWIYMGRFDYYTFGYVIQDPKYKDIWFKSRRKMMDFADEHDIRLGSYGWRGRPITEYEYVVGYSGKRHYFYTENGAFIAEESISGKLIGVESDEITTEYAELFEKLEHCSSYSPEDKSKTQYVPVTLEEFNEKIEKQVYTSHLARSGGQDVILEVCRYNDDQHTCELRKGSRWGDRLFKSETLTPETIFERFDFFHRDIYLENGNFSKREY